MQYDAYGNPIKPPRANGMLVPLLLALIASVAGNYWLWKERSKTAGDAIAATAKASALEAMQKEMTERLAKLEAERTTLVEEKEQAVKDAQAKATELAKLKDDVAGVAGTNDDADEKGKADDKGKAEAKGKDDKKESSSKADKKAEAKAKAKEDKKKKRKAAESSRKKEGGGEKPSVEREL